MNTHGEVIKLEHGIAFIDGVTDKCPHNGRRDSVYQSASGKLIFWHTYRKWASLTTEARDKLIHDYHNSIEDPIVMGTSQCSLCKKTDFPNSLDYQ